MSKVDRSTSSWRPSRRDVLFLGVGGLIAAVPLARRRPLELVRRNDLVMGTIARFAVAHRDRTVAEAAIDKALAALRQVDEQMSHFKPSSDIGRANLRAGRAPVRVSTETMEVLNEGLRWAADSNGSFDPCLGRAVNLWDVRHRHEPPPAGDVARMANRQLYRSLELTHHQGQPVVLFHDPDVSLDLGGIAKGYGVDRAVAALRESGIEQALVAAGGDIYAIGRSPSGEPWHIGIQSPDHADELAGSLYLENQAVSTSGDYQQFFQHHNRRYHHILDPQTGEPRRTPQRSITIVADTGMAADAAATVSFGMARPDADRILARHGARIAHSI